MSCHDGELCISVVTITWGVITGIILADQNKHKVNAPITPLEGNQTFFVWQQMSMKTIMKTVAVMLQVSPFKQIYYDCCC